MAKDAIEIKNHSGEDIVITYCTEDSKSNGKRVHTATIAPKESHVFFTDALMSIVWDKS